MEKRLRTILQQSEPDQPPRTTLKKNSHNQSFSINQSPDAPKKWCERLQIIPVSFPKRNEAFGTYALIKPGRQCGFILDVNLEFFVLPCDSQKVSSYTIQFLNIENSMSFSKISEPATIGPWKSTKISFELSRTSSTRSLNVAPANIFDLTQVCNAFNNLRYIYFPNIGDG